MAVHSPITPGALPELPPTLSFETRDQLEALVEQLIGLLDQADGDTDLEFAGDEDDASRPEDGSMPLGVCGFEDTEDDDPGEFSIGPCELELDLSDDEPSLAWSEGQSAAGDFEVDSNAWWYADNDCEIDAADGEPDMVPCIGSIAAHLPRTRATSVEIQPSA